MSKESTEKIQQHESSTSVLQYAEKLLHATCWTIAVLLLFLLVPSLSDGAIDALFIFYQPILPFVLMLWLWTLLVWFLDTYMIRYQACFASEHLQFLVSYTALTNVATAFTTALAVGVSVFVLLLHNGMVVHASLQPAMLLVVFVGLLANPLDGIIDNSTTAQRWFFLDTLRRVVLPFQVRPEVSRAFSSGTCFICSLPAC
jgi:hypothetical protein